MQRDKSFDEKKSLFYLLATPIGNLDELSSRSLSILNECDFIACEDTRNTLKLLTHFKIKKPLIACHEHNEMEASDKIINLLLNGRKGAFVSDAGYPLISDPGSRLVSKLLSNDIKVSVVSCSSALLNALVCSNLDTTHFYFHGFLSSKKSLRIKELKTLKEKNETLIFYESPHRIEDTLNDLLLIFGDRKACIARELTKIHEEFIRGLLKELSSLNKETLLGELVIVVEGNNCNLKREINENEIIEKVNTLILDGLSKKDAINRVSELLEINKNTVYKIVHKE